jgi:hypothetical protein
MDDDDYSYYDSLSGGRPLPLSMDCAEQEGDPG